MNLTIVKTDFSMVAVIVFDWKTKHMSYCLPWNDNWYIQQNAVYLPCGLMMSTCHATQTQTVWAICVWRTDIFQSKVLYSREQKNQKFLLFVLLPFFFWQNESWQISLKFSKYNGHHNLTLNRSDAFLVSISSLQY